MGYRSSTERHLEEIADRSTAIIAERACDPGFTIDDIVRAVYCSRRQVQRAFASRGTTFRQELSTVRMKRARELLENTELDQATIARTCGYQRSGYLRRAMKAWSTTTAA